MEIEITLSMKEARKVLAALDGPSTIDERTNTDPWRKVVNTRTGLGYGNHAELIEELECGHSIHSYGASAWDRQARRRRCPDCGKA